MGAFWLGLGISLGVVALVVVAVVAVARRRRRRPRLRQCPKCGGYLPMHKSKCNYAQAGWD